MPVRDERVTEIILLHTVLPTHVDFLRQQIKRDLGIELTFNAVRKRCDRLIKKGLLERYAPYTYVEKGLAEFYRSLESKGLV